MKAGSGLARGPQSPAELAERAVRQALAAAGLARAETVILLLSREFRRHPQPAILAAARCAGTLHVGGMTASGLLTEDGWLLDEPGAAALVAGSADGPAEAPVISLSGHSTLPFAWQRGAHRAGLLDSEAAAWAHGRVAEDGCAEISLPGPIRLAISCGLRLLDAGLPIDSTRGYDLCRVAGQTARDSLRRSLPGELRDHLPLHQIVGLRQPGQPAIPILAANADGSLTLAESLNAGERIYWALRQPLAAEQDMRQALAAASGEMPDATVDCPDRPIFKPAGALMFSCIGRGPLFYGDDDRDLLAFRERFPGLPLLGAYGSAQIARLDARNRLFHNAVVTLLFGNPHV